MIIPSPRVEWSVLYTGVYNTWVHDVSYAEFSVICDVCCILCHCVLSDVSCMVAAPSMKCAS